MREISLDTETTGLSVDEGDRIVEIGCVELDHLMPTGRTFHCYLNPDRPMSAGAADVTGLTDAFLADKPRFAERGGEFFEFIRGARLVIHNAAFDMKFLNAELGAIGLGPISPTSVIDTLAMARKRFPGSQASLDALCRRFGIDLGGREKHGALLDAELLAQVYLELKGGRQPALSLASGASEQDDARFDRRVQWSRPPRSRLTAEEASRHAAFVAELGGEALWPPNAPTQESGKVSG